MKGPGTAFTVLLLLPIYLLAQSPMPVKDDILAQKYSFVSTVFNRIINNSALDSFYSKLASIKPGTNNTVSIVHIGDSHLQADFLSSVIRNGLQDHFTNAGRGLVFPYQLAQSNGPDDIVSSSNIRWQFNRLAHSEININYGISGFGIHTKANDATIKMTIRGIAPAINQIKLFTNNNEGWQVNTDSINNISITAPANNEAKELYGISLENGGPGVIYHAIGVNGARYDHYNNADLFWQQIPALKADLYIISLGTNEAQMDVFSEKAFSKTLTNFIEKLRQSSPSASILFTTAPDSYKKRRYNSVLRQLNAYISNYCNNNYLPLWDLYQITNGYGSAYSWARRGLMTNDKVHFTSEGYRIQGNLLLAALAKGYNGYLNSRN